MKQSKITKLFFVLLIVLVIIYAINIAMTSTMLSAINERIDATRPAEIQIVRITADCDECSSIDPVVASLQQTGLVKITRDETIDYRSSRAQELIEKIGIRKIPTIVVFGEIAKPKLNDFWNIQWRTEINDGKGKWAVFDGVRPPYVNTATDEISGLVSLIKIKDTSCQPCGDMSAVVDNFKQGGIVFSEERTIDYNTEEAKSLIELHNIQRIPALLISKNIIDYPNVAQIWDQLNVTEREGFFALHALQPPYRDVRTGEIKGLVTVVYFNDSSCTDCYDVLLNKRILEQNFGMYIAEEKIIDINSSEGQDLVQQYEIKAVPVIVVSPDAAVYDFFSQAWEQVGTVEDNGWFVMRNPGVLGTYRDLAADETVGTVPGGQKEIIVQGTEFRFTPSSIEVRKGETVRIVFENVGGALHDFAIEELGIKTDLVAPGNKDVLEFTPEESGNLTFYCTVPGHREAGMIGTLKVSV